MCLQEKRHLGTDAEAQKGLSGWQLTRDPSLSPQEGQVT